MAGGSGPKPIVPTHPTHFSSFARPTLTSIDISYNQLEGHLPDLKAFREAPLIKAFRNNKGLCGNFTGLEACSTERKKGNKNFILVTLLILGIVLLLFISVGIYFLCRRIRSRKIQSREAPTEDLFAIWGNVI